MRRLPFIVLLAAMCGSFAASAADQNPAGRARLEQFLDHLTSFTATFEQRLFDEYGDLIETSTGDVAIEKPGKFRWEYRDPYAQLIVTDGATLWVYDVDLEQVSVNPMASDNPDSPAALLVGDVDLDSRYVVSESRTEEGVDWVALVPRAEQAQYQAVEIGFDHEGLRGMRLSDNLRQVTAITFDGIERNVEIAPAMFAFEPPAGVDVLTNSPARTSPAP